MRNYKITSLVFLVILIFFFVFQIPIVATTKVTVAVGSWYETVAPLIEERFNKDNPGMELELILIPWDGYLESVTMLAMKRGDAPNVIAVNTPFFLAMINREFLEPLDEMIANGDLSADNFFPGPWNLGKVNEIQYGIPHRMSNYCMFYNPKLFAEAGLDPDRPPENLSEFLDYAKKLTYGERYGFGLKGSMKSPSQTINDVSYFIWGHGGDFLNANNTKAEINSPESKSGVKFWADLYIDSLAPEGSIGYNKDDTGHLFGAEVVAMEFATDSQPDYFAVTAQEGFEYRVAIPPTKATPSTAWNMTIPKNSPDKEASWRFIEWFTSPEVLPEIAVRMPSVKSAIGHPKWSEGMWPTFLKAAEYSYNFPNIEQWPEIEIIICEYLQDILTKKSSVDDAMDQAANEINEILR